MSRDRNTFAKLKRTAAEIRAQCRALGDMLIRKNNSYGDAALNPIAIFSDADPVARLNARIDEKLSRMRHDPNAFGEDTAFDLVGCLILRKIAMERKKRARKKRPSLSPNRANRN